MYLSASMSIGWLLKIDTIPDAIALVECLIIAFGITHRGSTILRAPALQSPRSQSLH